MAGGWNSGRRAGQQKINVLLSLRGAQDTRVTVHHADTDSAVVSARIGDALLYFHDWPAAASIMRGWQQVGRQATLLPGVRHAPPDMLVADRVRPVTVIDILGTVDVTGGLLQREGFPHQLTIKMGRLELLIHDRAAYASTRAAFRDVEALCSSVLPRPEPPDLRSVTMETVTKAVAAPPRTTGRPRRRPETARSEAPKRGPTSGRWLQ